MIAAAEHLSHHVSKKAACEAFSVPRATFYRHQCRKTRPVDTVKERPAPPLALEPDERQQVIDILHSDRFCDDTPYEVFATLLDEGHYHCSIRTMYRLLENRAWGCQRASAACATAQLCQARAAGNRTKPGLVLGYHQAQRTGQMDLLLPVRDHGHLQPLRCRLDDRPAVNLPLWQNG